MIKIIIPKNNIKERIYILDVLFNEFLGLEYEFVPTDVQNYHMALPNGKQLIIEDHFFNKFPKDKEYLSIQNLPENTSFKSNKFALEDDVVILFGNDKLEVSENRIICGPDIFASAFFMLSRWEEYVNKSRDLHDRFPAKESVAYKNGFLDRPIVNEYVELLWNMLYSLDSSIERKERVYTLVLTHDVDIIQKYSKLYSGTKEIGVNIFKHLNLPMSLKLTLQKIKSHFHYNYDPFNTFDYLMDLSESAGLQSHFFFQIMGETQHDNKYDRNTKHLLKIIENINSRGHAIGIHPSYNTYNSKKLWKEELNYLQELVDSEITFGRQHFLRFDVPTTWQIWEDMGMGWESTMSYVAKEGFRCGVCYEFPVYNILTRKKLSLTEIPLIVMDGSFVTYQPDVSPDEMNNKINQLMDTVKKYNGEFVFLWHNSSFGYSVWENYKNVYENILKININSVH